MIENRAVGIKSREVYEAPAAIVLIEAHQALEDLVLTRAELQEKRRLEDAGRPSSTRASGSARSARRSTRSSTRHRSVVEGEVGVELRAGDSGRDGRRSPNALYAEDARVVRRRRDVPARGGRGLRPDRGARDRAGRRPRAEGSAGMTLWAGTRRGARSRPRWGVPPRRRRRAPPVRLRGDARPRAAPPRRPGCSPTRSSPRSRRGSPRSARRAQRSSRATRTSTRRSSGCSGPSGARSTRGARATTRSQRPSASTSPTRAPRRVEGDRARSRARSSTSPSARRTRSMPGYTHLQRAQPVTLGHHLLAWVEMLDRDRARFAFAAEQAAPSPLGRGSARGLDAAARGAARADAATRSTRSPTATSRSTTSTRARSCFGHLSRIGEEIVPLGTSEFGFVRLPGGGGDRLVDDAAEAQPRRRRARPRQGRNGDRAPRRAPGDRQGTAARLQPRPPGGQAAGLRRRGATSAARSPRCACSCDGLEVDHERAAEAVSDPALLATDAAEELVRERGAVPRRARAGGRSRARGPFEPPHDAAESVAARSAPGPGGVAEALAAARARFDKTLGSVRTLEDVAGAVGTPFYAYDADLFRDRIARFRAAFGDAPPDVFYALKANDALALVAIAAAKGSARTSSRAASWPRLCGPGSPPSASSSPASARRGPRSGRRSRRACERSTSSRSESWR